MLPTSVYFIITRNCNYSCPFCIRKNISDISQNIMDYKKAISVFEAISDTIPNVLPVITGGEPFLHTDWELFVQKALSIFGKAVITSNGSFCEEIASRLYPYLCNGLTLQMSLDGLKDTHDKLRGKNAYDKVLNNLSLLSSVSSHINISTTVTPENLQSIVELGSVLNNYKFRHWKVSPVQVEDPLNDRIIDYREWNFFVDELLKHCKYSVLIQKFFDFELYDKFLATKHNTKNVPIYNCGIGKYKIYISPTFNVYPCSCMDDSIGNVLEEDFLSIYKKLNILGDIKVDKKSPCFTCKYLSICNGGCPGYSKKVFNKINFGDVRCPIVSQYIKDEKH